MRMVVLSIAVLLPMAVKAQTDPVWVPGSSQKVCQPNGEIDYETGLPTVSQTETNYGLVGDDLGASFEHNGKLWLLFGDTNSTAKYNGKPNGQTDPPRVAADNDAIAFTSGVNVEQCLKLDFVRDSIGAFQNPVVVNAMGKPAITLGPFEIPITGIDVGGRMYMIFATDKNSTFSTRSVVAYSDDDGVSYHYLYDFSAPTTPLGNDAKFVNVALVSSATSLKDGYLYFWGSAGGTGYRNSSVYVARKLATAMAAAGGMQYFTGFAKDGVTPNWSAMESDAVQLFQDMDGTPPAAANCTGELGVDYNTFFQRWVMLYNCLDKTKTALNGVYMRMASQPWGPWGASQTIFNAQRDRGDCFFIHRAVTATSSPACDSLSGPGRLDTQGGSYGPYFLSPFTTSNAGAGTSTFYYLLSTWNPYIEVIMKTTIQSPTSTAPVIGLVANAEGESAAIAPNTWLEIKGANLAKPGSGRTWQSSDFVGGKMPTQLDGVSVTVNGKSSFVYYISPTQVNVLAPPDALSGSNPSGAVQVVLTNNGAVSAAYSAAAQSMSPSFFVFNGGPYVAAVHLSGALIGPATLYPGSTTPVKPGETIMLYANGFGPTSVPVVSGSSRQSGDLSPLPAVTIGGVAAKVGFAGLAAVGQFQFNVTLPGLLADGDQPVVATYNGSTTAMGTLITVQH
jgi:uncharacterized protein (TIGR03437 family)